MKIGSESLYVINLDTWLKRTRLHSCFIQDWCLHLHNKRDIQFDTVKRTHTKGRWTLEITSLNPSEVVPGWCRPWFHVYEWQCKTPQRSHCWLLFQTWGYSQSSYLFFIPLILGNYNGNTTDKPLRTSLYVVSTKVRYDRHFNNLTVFCLVFWFQLSTPWVDCLSPASQSIWMCEKYFTIYARCNLLLLFIINLFYHDKKQYYFLHNFQTYPKTLHVIEMRDYGYKYLLKIEKNM